MGVSNAGGGGKHCRKSEGKRDRRRKDRAGKTQRKRYIANK